MKKRETHPNPVSLPTDFRTQVTLVLFASAVAILLGVAFSVAIVLSSK